MKAKLIKTNEGYHLKSQIKDIPKGINVYNKINDNEGLFGFGGHTGKLSLKNCEVIELGYDLNELADKYYMKFENQIGNPVLFYRYFKLIFPKALELVEHRLSKETEWQVEVIMDRIPADLAPGGWDMFPKLDENNCLILKRAE